MLGQDLLNRACIVDHWVLWLLGSLILVILDCELIIVKLLLTKS